MPKEPVRTVGLTDTEISAVLAGLRLLQLFRRHEVTTDKPELSVMIQDIERDSGTCLSTHEIDNLCERINVV